MLPKNISTDQWHNRSNTTAHTLAQTYGLPSAWIRRSAQTGDANLMDRAAEQVTYVRAAAIFNRSTPVTPLTVEPTWSVVCRPPGKPFKIVIVSVADAAAWIQRAYESGAQAWWLADAGPVYVYEPVQHPDPGESEPESTVVQGRGEYDRDLVIADLVAGHLTQTAIGHKYGITRSMVNRIDQQRRAASGLMRKRGPTTVPLTPEQQTAIIADIQSGTMTKVMIAERHDVPVNRITLLIDKYNLKGLLPRGYNAKILSFKYTRNNPD